MVGAARAGMGVLAVVKCKLAVVCGGWWVWLPIALCLFLRRISFGFPLGQPLLPNLELVGLVGALRTCYRENRNEDAISVRLLLGCR